MLFLGGPQQADGPSLIDMFGPAITLKSLSFIRDDEPAR